MKNHYYKRFWNESRVDAYSNWGASCWYFETDSDGNVLKQLQEYDNGIHLIYYAEKQEDKYGGLSKVALNNKEYSEFAISKDEFETIWGKIYWQKTRTQNSPIIDFVTATISKYSIGEYLKENRSDQECIFLATFQQNEYFIDLSFYKKRNENIGFYKLYVTQNAGTNGTIGNYDNQIHFEKDYKTEEESYNDINYWLKIYNDLTSINPTEFFKIRTVYNQQIIQKIEENFPECGYPRHLYNTHNCFDIDNYIVVVSRLYDFSMAYEHKDYDSKAINQELICIYDSNKKLVIKQAFYLPITTILDVEYDYILFGQGVLGDSATGEILVYDKKKNQFEKAMQTPKPIVAITSVNENINITQYNVSGYYEGEFRTYVCPKSDIPKFNLDNNKYKIITRKQADDLMEYTNSTVILEKIVSMTDAEYFDELFEQFPIVKENIYKEDEGLIHIIMEKFASYTIEQILNNNETEFRRCVNFQETRIELMSLKLVNAFIVSYCESLLLGYANSQMKTIKETLPPRFKKEYLSYETHYYNLGKK